MTAVLFKLLISGAIIGAILAFVTNTSISDSSTRRIEQVQAISGLTALVCVILLVILTIWTYK